MSFSDEILAYARVYEQYPNAVEKLTSWSGAVGEGARRAKSCYEAIHGAVR